MRVSIYAFVQDRLGATVILECGSLNWQSLHGRCPHGKRTEREANGARTGDMVYAEVLVDGLVHPWIAYVADSQPNLLELSADSLPPGVTAATPDATLRSIHLLPLSYPSFRLELFDSVSADYRALVTFHTGLPAPPP